TGGAEQSDALHRSSLPTSAVAKAQHQVEGCSRGKERRVEAVERPAVAGEQAPRVLYLHAALQHGLEEVTGRRGEHHDEAARDGLPDGEEVMPIRVERTEGAEHA